MLKINNRMEHFRGQYVYTRGYAKNKRITKTGRQTFICKNLFHMHQPNNIR